MQTLQLNKQKANNLLNGLTLLHAKACSNLANVPHDDNEIEMRMYFKTLIKDIQEQRRELMELLNN